DETVAKLVDLYDTGRLQFQQLKRVCDRIRDVEAAGGVDANGEIEIKASFYKTVNRRYHAERFWPIEVTGKDFREVVIWEARPADGEPALVERSSRRGRWFRARASGLEDRYADRFVDQFSGDRRPLYGVDVSTSQLQVLSVFLGLEKLEQRLQKESF